MQRGNTNFSENFFGNYQKIDRPRALDRPICSVKTSRWLVMIRYLCFAISSCTVVGRDGLAVLYLNHSK